MESIKQLLLAWAWARPWIILQSLALGIVNLRLWPLD